MQLIENPIAPSLLSADFSILKKEILSISPEVDYLHLDIMDGDFVPNITFGPFIVKSIVNAGNSIKEFKYDTHLMIKNPDNYIKDFIDAGSSIITVHAETVDHLDRTISLIKDLGGMAGVALNPATPCNILKYIIQKIDLVLVMTVNPGFGGQSFIPYTIEKIEKIRKLADEYNPNLIIEVDGGINKDNINRISKAGANLFVAGSAVFKNKNRIDSIKTLRKNSLI